MTRSYPTPAGPVDREMTVKKSRFIAWLRPVKSTEGGHAVLQQARTLHPDANHYCHAWLIGDPASGQGAMHDDGEPSGTAGKPIFNVIQHKGIGDVMVVVIRYFGGVKLGAGGLVRAYSGAAESVLSAMTVVEHVPEVTVMLTFGFAGEQPLRYWCEQHGGRLTDIDYGQRVSARVTVAEELLADLESFCAAKHMVVGHLV